MGKTSIGYMDIEFAGQSMDNKDKDAILTLIKIIMSSINIHDQQREALEYFKSNTDVLRSLLLTKTECNNDMPSTKIAPVGSDNGEPNDATNQIIEDISVCQMPENKFKQNLEITSLFSQIEPYDVSANTDVRHSDCEGDYHHRGQKPSVFAALQEKFTENLEIFWEKECNLGVIDPKKEKLENFIFVKKMIDILMHTTCKQHQHAILTVLEADEDIKKMFIDENAKMRNKMKLESEHPDKKSCDVVTTNTNAFLAYGNSTPGVFRNTDSYTDSDNLVSYGMNISAKSCQKYESGTSDVDNINRTLQTTSHSPGNTAEETYVQKITRSKQNANSCPSSLEFNKMCFPLSYTICEEIDFDQ